MAPLSLTLPFVLLPALALAQEPIHVPLSRRSRGAHLDLNKEADKLRNRYGFANGTTGTIPRRSGKRASADIPIVNQDADSSYFGSITIGTP
ncbi:hypothetical protein NLJ89_g7319 [Agrocybe chaxingu]|uniref:Uncharacterized protein n=1 Tax=Agrocybe chaxingu TaxID=84603 RepID=A0A9W8JXK6_9AGAR|nr:hypothetical protein NLJ89_g7319 [Agrocybe chaxingu]